MVRPLRRHDRHRRLDPRRSPAPRREARRDLVRLRVRHRLLAHPGVERRRLHQLFVGRVRQLRPRGLGCRPDPRPRPGACTSSTSAATPTAPTPASATTRTTRTRRTTACPFFKTWEDTGEAAAGPVGPRLPTAWRALESHSVGGEEWTQTWTVTPYLTGNAPQRNRVAGRSHLVGENGRVVDISYPAELPVSQRRDDIAAAIRDHQVVIVAGETGSGKTTQLPKICLELGRGGDGQADRPHPAAPDRGPLGRRADRRGARAPSSATWSATRSGSPTGLAGRAGSS